MLLDIMVAEKNTTISHAHFKGKFCWGGVGHNELHKRKRLIGICPEWILSVKPKQNTY